MSSCRTSLGRAISVGLAALVFAAQGQAGETWELPSEIRENLERRTDQGMNLGAVMAVIDEDGDPHFFTFGHCGFDHGQSLGSPNSNTLFEIGSISKVFTGIALAHMVATEGLSLDDPIEDYLPDQVTVPSRNGELIRLIHLATHRSALPRLPTNMNPADSNNPYADYTIENLYEFLSGYELPRGIGAAPEYSNLAVGLLGHLLELETELSYEDLVRERILEPPWHERHGNPTDG